MATFIFFQLQTFRKEAEAELWLIGGIFLSIWIIPFIGLLFAGYQALSLGAGLARKSVIKSSLKNEPTILLLRCFALDSSMVKKSRHIVGILDIFQLFRVRLEEVIVRETFLHAPVLAVANPREDQEPLGAMREYFSDAAWQPFVSNKIKDSHAIIFLLGRGGYTGWETQKIIDSKALGKVLFMVPPDPKSALEYLEQNPNVLNAAGGKKIVDAISTGKVRGFVIGATGTTLVTNRLKSELAYLLATRRLLQSVFYQPDKS